jgi:hypothetical protein
MISKDKNYRTLGGYEFKIYEIYEDKIHGAYTMGDTWLIDSVTQNDLIEISPYEGFKIDDKVLVWDDGYEHEKILRHFAGTNSNTGKPGAWQHGRTSFTTYEKSFYDNCIKYEENND